MPPASCTAPPPPSAPAGAGMGQIAGYTVADYLIQHASRERRYARVPASTWDAILSHIRDPADAARLADSARSRLLYRYAIPLYRHAADAGDGYAAWRWPGCWPSAATWTRRRRYCGPSAALPESPVLAALLAERGDLDGLRARADAGDEYAARRLADLLAERGDLDGLRARADAGDGRAARRLAELLAERGDLDEAVQILRARADAGDGHAARRLADLLAERGDLDEAADLRARADAGDGPPPAAGRPAGRARRPGRGVSLRARADAGDGSPPGGWPSCWPSAATWTRRQVCAPGRRRRRDCRLAAGRAAGRARRPGRGGTDPARPGRRRRRGCRRAAGRPAGRARRPGRAARPGRRRRRGMPPGGWPTCWPSAATWTGHADPARPGRRRRLVGYRAAGGRWPSCWRSAATWTGPRSTAGRRRRPRLPPGGWPGCAPGRLLAGR